MRRHFASVLIPLVVSCAVAGGWALWGPAATGGVAIVDLDEIARRLGRTEQMQQSITTQTEQLNQVLAALQQDAAQKLDDLKVKVGPHPSPEKASQLQNASVAINVELNKQRQIAEFKLGQHKQKMAAEFRQEARPHTERVARSRGFQTVVTKNDAMVFSFSDSVDITSAVYQAMLEQGHAALPAAVKPQSPAAQPMFPAAPQANPVQRASHEEPAGR